MNITGLDHLVLKVEDVDAALAFYGEVLGLEVLRLEEFRKGDVGFVSVRVSDESIIDLSPGGPVADEGRNVDHFCLVVDEPDMESLLTELRSLGVEAHGPASGKWGARGRGASFTVRDPDGNKIELKSYAG